PMPTRLCPVFVPACRVDRALGCERGEDPCLGSTDRNGDTVLGSLALDDNSATTKTYGTAKGDRQLVLLYSVTGCRLPPKATITDDQVSILPAKDGADLPGAPLVDVSVAKPDAMAVATKVSLKLDDIDPGTHSGIVRIHVPQYLHDSFTPISASRTAWWLWPLLLGLAGALAGVLWAIGIHFADSINMRFSPLHGLVFGVLAIGAGLVAGYAYWDNQDVWTVGDNGWPTLVAGFTASTTGALAGVTAALFSTNSGGGEAKKPAPASG
ncbi:MAG: hypothetical protein ACRDPU_00840, partial [Thermoleophilia bacterium]